jgi:hypothetical protein
MLEKSFMVLSDSTLCVHHTPCAPDGQAFLRGCLWDREVAEAAVGREDAAALAGFREGVRVVVGFDRGVKSVLKPGRDEVEFALCGFPTA